MSPSLLQYRGKNVSRIHVMCMFRDNAEYLSTFFVKMMNKMENIYSKTEFVYYFIENNSEDDTRAILETFASSRQGSKVYSYDSKKDYCNYGEGTHFGRIAALSDIRNRLVDMTTPLPDDEWCLMIDSNIFFTSNVLAQVFSPENDVFTLSHDEEKEIGMMGAFVQQLVPHLFVQESKPKSLHFFDHYYDTYSVVDKNGVMHHPLCAFELCTFCKPEKREFAPIPKTENVVDVRSCFGGFVFIKSEILNHPRVRWDTVCISKTSICEHVLFCDRLRTVFDKRVVVLQKLQGLYRTY